MYSLFYNSLFLYSLKSYYSSSAVGKAEYSATFNATDPKIAIYSVLALIPEIVIIALGKYCYDKIKQRSKKHKKSSGSKKRRIEFKVHISRSRNEKDKESRNKRKHQKKALRPKRIKGQPVLKSVKKPDKVCITIELEQ